MIDRETVQRIMDSANIVDVVSEFVTLKRAGVNYRGLCPFHDEKTCCMTALPSILILTLKSRSSFRVLRRSL